MSRADFYVDESGQHRWRIVAANGLVVADSGESYRNRADAEHGLKVALEAEVSDDTTGEVTP